MDRINAHPYNIGALQFIKEKLFGQDKNSAVLLPMEEEHLHKYRQVFNYLS